MANYTEEAPLFSGWMVIVVTKFETVADISDEKAQQRH